MTVIAMVMMIIASSRREGAMICLRPLQVDNIFVFIRQVAVLFRHVSYITHQQQADL